MDADESARRVYPPGYTQVGSPSAAVKNSTRWVYPPGIVWLYQVGIPRWVYPPAPLVCRRTVPPGTILLECVTVSRGLWHVICNKVIGKAGSWIYACHRSVVTRYTHFFTLNVCSLVLIAACCVFSCLYCVVYENLVFCTLWSRLKSLDLPNIKKLTAFTHPWSTHKERAVSLESFTQCFMWHFMNFPADEFLQLVD